MHFHPIVKGGRAAIFFLGTINAAMTNKERDAVKEVYRAGVSRLLDASLSPA